MNTLTANPQSILTPRETQIIQRIAQGKTDKQIARDLNCSPRTVHVHNEHARLKLHAANKAHLVARAFETGILRLLTVALLIGGAVLSAVDNTDQNARLRHTRSAGARVLRVRGRREMCVEDWVGDEWTIERGIA